MTHTILEKLSDTIAANYNFDIEAKIHSEDWQELQKLCQRAEQEKAYLNISNIADKNHQYVDLVMEGGGVLGIAFIGYILALESVGIRFLNIGGASAGSITALLLAAADKPAEEKSQKLMQIMGNIPMATFLDSENKKVKQLILDYAAGKINIHLNSVQDVISHLPWLLLTGLPVFKILKKHYGLCKGEAFLNWIHNQALQQLNCLDTSTLYQRMNDLPDGIKTAINKHRHQQRIVTDKNYASLCLIATDLTTETRLQFPKDEPLFEFHSNNHLAEFVRCSMSIPLVFQPYPLKTIPAQEKLWQKVTGRPLSTVKIPEKCYIVDGGIVSNFPIDVFHSPKMPACPTFGAKLRLDNFSTKIERLSQFLGQNINAARNSLEREFIRKNIDYQNLVSIIDTGDHSWLNFNMNQQDQIDLILRGFQEGLTFLFGSNDGQRKGFDWEHYQNIRRNLLQQRTQSNVTDFPKSA
jgi:NTE family protein